MKYSISSFVANILLAALILSMLLFQTAYMNYKLAIILLLFVINLFKGEYRLSNFNVTIFGILSIILILGVYSILSALLMGTLSYNEVLERVPFLLIHPILFYVLLPNIMGDKIQNLCNILIVGHFLMTIITLYNIYAVFTGLPPLMFLEGETYVFDDNGMGVASGTTYQILVTMPLFFVMGWSKKISKTLFLIGSVITIAYVIIAGSNALVFIMMLCLFIPFIAKRVLGKENVYDIHSKLLIIPLSIVLIMGVMELKKADQIQILYSDFKEHFSNVDERYEQRKLFIAEWKKSPFFGEGYGKTYFTSAKGFSKQFESMYHLSLATTGLLGLSLLFLYLGIIVYNVYVRSIIEKNPYCLGLMLGLVACIICNSTNPVLASFDRLLSIYLCIGCIADSSINNRIDYNEI